MNVDKGVFHYWLRKFRWMGEPGELGRPALTSQLDERTGIDFPEAGVVRIQVGGVEIARWNSGGGPGGGILYPAIAGEVGILSFAYPLGNVKRYGATGDGITDDTLAIQNAIASVAAQPSKGRVTLPPGRYILGVPASPGFGAIALPTGVSLYGEQGACLVCDSDPSPVSDRFFLSVGTAATPVASDVVIEGIEFDGLLTAPAALETLHGIYLFDASRIVVRDCVFHNFDGDCLRGFGSSVRFESNTCYSVTGQAVRAAGGESWLIANNTLRDTMNSFGGAAEVVIVGSADVASAIVGTVISNNVVSAWGPVVLAFVNDATVEGNYLKPAAGADSAVRLAIAATGRNILIDGNVIDMEDAPTRSILCDGSFSALTITGNRIARNDEPAIFFSANAVDVDDLVIAENNITVAPGAVVAQPDIMMLGSSHTRVSITGNLTSQSTVNALHLGAASCSKVSVQGNTFAGAIAVATVVDITISGNSAGRSTVHVFGVVVCLYVLNSLRVLIQGNALVYDVNDANHAIILRNAAASCEDVTLVGNLISHVGTGKHILEMGALTRASYINNAFKEEPRFTLSGAPLYVGNQPIVFANLPAFGDGSVVYCPDGLANSNPLTGASTGALAKRLNGIWRGD